MPFRRIDCQQHLIYKVKAEYLAEFSSLEEYEVAGMKINTSESEFLELFTSERGMEFEVDRRTAKGQVFRYKWQK